MAHNRGRYLCAVKWSQRWVRTLFLNIVIILVCSVYTRFCKHLS